MAGRRIGEKDASMAGTRVDEKEQTAHKKAATMERIEAAVRAEEKALRTAAAWGHGRDATTAQRGACMWVGERAWPRAAERETSKAC